MHVTIDTSRQWKDYRVAGDAKGLVMFWICGPRFGFQENSTPCDRLSQLSRLLGKNCAGAGACCSESSVAFHVIVAILALLKTPLRYTCKLLNLEA